MPGIRTLAACAFLLLAATMARASVLPGFDELERSLELDRAQKAQFDAAVAATQRALLSIAFGGLALKERIAAELDKQYPDLGAIARAQNDIIEQSRPLFRDARREWERFYAMLRPAQEKQARAFVEEKLKRLERLGETVRDLLDGKVREQAR
jgi:hypothetical protein